ncbi:MAG: peptide ABC transporter substrate-binding protein [Chloroflexi bacterium]|nr:peptide ABC transporter substrate-binding protein [Chloroflexota bacterium]
MILSNRKIRILFWSVTFLALALLLLGCTREVVKEVPVEKVVEKRVEVVKEVPKEVVVTKEVVKEVPKEVVKEVEKTVVITPTPSPAKVVYVNAGTEPPTLDPALAEDSVSINMVENLFVGLTNFNPQTSKVEPDLAFRWVVSDDGLTYTFYLRNDAKWSDGKTVTAHDVAYGILRTLDPKTASNYAYVLTAIIKNGEAFNSGKITDPSVVGVKVRADNILEVTLEHPAAYFPGIASMWVMYPQPKWAIEAHGDKWTDPKNIVTNGPYKLLKWVHSNSLVMVKNPDYYEAKKVLIATLDFRMIEEESTAMTMYEAGSLDALGGSLGSVPLEDLDRIKKDAALSKQLTIAPSLTTYYYGFTVDKPPFDNVLVRKAFTAAIDRQRLVDFVLKGGQKPALTFTAPGNFGAVDAVKEGIGIPFDPAKAKAWLAEAGYPGGKGFPEVTLMYNTSQAHKKIAETIAAMWKEHLGVDVKIVNQEFRVYLQTLHTDPPHIWRLGWGADYPDANNWLNEVFNSKSPSNNGRFKSAEFDQLVEQAAKEQDPAKRIDLYKKAEKILTQDVAAIAPIYHYTSVALTKPNVERTFAPFGGEQFNTWKAFVR